MPIFKESTIDPAAHEVEVSGFLPLKAADCHLLLALSREPMYGYALLQAMDSDSRGAVGMDIGALYRALDRLMRVGLIGESKSDDTEPNRGRPRRYYAITELGRAVLSAELARLRGVLEVARTGRAGS